MKKVGIYSSDRADASEMLQGFVPGIQSLEHVDCTFLDINEFRRHGLESDIDCFVLFGVLHGPGHAYKACVQQGTDFIYIDHAYFKPGYKNGWFRATRNHHTMNTLETAPPDRWDTFFSADHPLEEWRSSPAQQGENILILPPTNTTAWMFDAYDWTDSVSREIQERTSRPIRIREKPREPTVNAAGDFTGLKTNPTQATSIEQDLQDAYCVVSFNSNAAIDATRRGIPVITTAYGACHSITYSIDDLETRTLLSEPRRGELFHWLAYNQFHVTEFQNGQAWKRFFDPDSLQSG